MISHLSNQRASILRYCRKAMMIYPFRLKQNNQDVHSPTHTDLLKEMLPNVQADFRRCLTLKHHLLLPIEKVIQKTFKC